MTESEWLTSNDPAAMLTHLRPSGLSGTASRISERKLRLFACACLWAAGRKDGWMNALEEKGETHGLTDYQWAEVWAKKGKTEVPDATRAALLRDIVGNPFRPVTVGEVTDCPTCHGAKLGALISSEGHGAGGKSVFAKYKTCCGTGTVFAPPAWLTHSVVNMARAVYEDRAWGHLPILADLLEEEECPEEVTVECRACRGEGKYDADNGGSSRPWKMTCRFCGGRCSVRVPNPLLQHLRGPGPHAKGCHVIDLLTGRG